MAKKVKKMARGGFGMMKPNFNPTNVDPQIQNTLKSIASSLQNKGGNSFIPNIPKERPMVQSTPVAQSKPRGGFIPNIPKERPMVQSTPSPALARGMMMDAKPRGRFNKGGTTKLHSITKSNKKSNW